MRNINKIVTLIGAIVTVLILFSSVTAVPAINSSSVVKSTQDIELTQSVYEAFEQEFNEVANNLDEIIDDEQFLKARSIAKLRCGVDVFENINTNEIIEQAKTALEEITIEDVLNEMSTVSTLNTENLTNLLQTLFYTILAEFFVYVMFYSSIYGVTLFTVTKLFYASAVINTITNPIMNIIYQQGGNLIVLEFLAFSVESVLIYKQFRELTLKILFCEAITLSLLANVFSLIVASDPSTE